MVNSAERVILLLYGVSWYQQMMAEIKTFLWVKKETVFINEDSD